MYTCGYMCTLSLSLFSFRVKNERSDARVENRRTINRKEEEEGRGREEREKERGLVWFKSPLASLLSSNSRCYGDNLERLPPSTQNPPLPSLIFTETFFRNLESADPLIVWSIEKRREKIFSLSFPSFFFFFEFFHRQGILLRRSFRNFTRSIRSSLLFKSFSPEFDLLEEAHLRCYLRVE